MCVKERQRERGFWGNGICTKNYKQDIYIYIYKISFIY